jgi:hypothetical protein
MTNEQRIMVATGLAAGVDTKKIADAAKVEEVDVKIFAAWWHDVGRPNLTS